MSQSPLEAEPHPDPCVWEPDPGCLSDEWDTYDTVIQHRALRLATSSLQQLTYSRVGTCPITIRPCLPEPPCGCAWAPYLWKGEWRNGCPCRTVCAPKHELVLPGPVGYIDSFKVDGVEVDLESGDWRMDNNNILVWQGEGDWPISEQDLNKPDTEPGTFSITYSRSYPVGEQARSAVAYLAMEFAKACIPKKKCDLPRGVTQVTRNGVSFSIEAGLFPGGLTGIDSVDAFILDWAPAGAPTQTAQVLSPRDVLVRKNRVTTGIPRGA